MFNTLALAAPDSANGGRRMLSGLEGGVDSSDSSGSVRARLLRSGRVAPSFSCSWFAFLLLLG